MKKVILTGDRPTGRLHVGHYVGSLSERVRLQNSGDYDEIYIMIADAQALTDNAEHPEKVRQNIIQVALDYLACGIDPEKSTIFIQSMVPELTELTFYYMNLVTVARVQRNPTVKSEIKMRKSLGNCIYLSDEADVVKKKVMSMFTDPNHLRVQDPGKVEGNPVFIYLDAFCKDEYFAEFLPDYQNLDELKEHYQRGGLGDVKVKKFLNKVLEAELGPIRERRKMWEQRIPDVYDILQAGSEVAEKKAAETLNDVREAMKINYFDGDFALN